MKSGSDIRRYRTTPQAQPPSRLTLMIFSRVGSRCGASNVGLSRDDNGKLIITHFGGPTWQAKDGSKVVGRLVDRVTVDATSIPWLLLSAASTAGADGDRLVGTTYIQRIATTGGLAPPAAECTATTAGTKAEGPYTGDYYCWKKGRA